MTNAAYMALHLTEAIESASYRRRQRAGAAEPARVAARLKALGVARGRLLDVGAGLGRFTRCFQSLGFAVTPLEIHPMLAARIEAETGLAVMRTPFEAWTPQGGEAAPFDAIVMSQTLEHAVEPGVWLARASRLLAPAGVLFVSVPNFASLLVAGLGAREGNICPPTHLNFFTPRSLAALARTQGLTPLRIETPSVLPPEPAVDAVAGRLALPAKALAAPLGLLAWAALRLAEPLGSGRFVYGFFGKGRGSRAGD